jgi:hypothetical protein
MSFHDVVVGFEEIKETNAKLIAGWILTASVGAIDACSDSVVCYLTLS